MMEHIVLRGRAGNLLAMSTDKIDAMRKEEIKELVHEFQVQQVELEAQNRELLRTQEELQVSRESGSDRTVMRSRAENLLEMSADEIDSMRQFEIKGLIHELQVHQIELEMQNQELRRIQEELLAQRQKSHAMWDFAPVACLEITAEGLVIDSNFTGCAWLGRARGDVKGEKFSCFIAPESQDAWHLHCRKLFSTGEPQHCELQLKNGGRLVRANSHIPTSGGSCCYITLTDMTDLAASLLRAGSDAGVPPDSQNIFLT